MRKLIGGFTHRPGLHAPASALRDILEFSGHKLSEETVFGLGCGHGFMYWRSKDMLPPILVGGNASEGIVEACRILGIDVKRETTESEEAAWKETKKLIDSNIPVALRVDLHDLGYMSAPMSLHFGMHVVVAIGYDEEKGEAYVLDNRLAGIQSISFENLSRARSSKFKPFPPNNIWYKFTFPKSLTKLEGAIKIAIRENVENFLDPTAKNSGLRGIDYLAERLESWPEILPPSELALTLKTTHLFIDGNGTGLFRRIYSRFLNEAHALLGEEQLSISKELLERSAESWTRVGELLLKASGLELGEVSKLLSEAKNEVRKCYDLEKEAFGLLDALSERWLEQVI
jgi:hypothetical protein